jgi:hypothetical protein
VVRESGRCGEGRIWLDTAGIRVRGFLRRDRTVGKCLAVALLVTFSWIGGLGQDARAGVTIDVVFEGETSPSGITIPAGDEGGHCFCYPECYYPLPGYCMEVVLYTTDPILGMGVSVMYDSDNGLALDNMYEWKGVGVSWNKAGTVEKSCSPEGGLEDDGGVLQSFDCSIPEPNNPPVLAAGTYTIGTIIWDGTGTTPGTEVIEAVFSSGEGITAVINGNAVDVTSSVVVGSHILNIIGDPTLVPSMSATGVMALGVAVLGIGVIGLIIAARRQLN